MVSGADDSFLEWGKWFLVLVLSSECGFCKWHWLKLLDGALVSDTDDNSWARPWFLVLAIGLTLVKSSPSYQSLSPTSGWLTSSQSFTTIQSMEFVRVLLYTGIKNVESIS